MSETNEANQLKQVNDDIFSISFPNHVQSPDVIGDQNDFEVPSDFEKAVDATGYGIFNCLLLLALLPGGMAAFFDLSAMSYVLPSAECDLELTLFHKGVLNAVTYFGMIFSAFLWGFLADTRGRRSLLRLCYLADIICNIMCSMSQSFYALLIFKFLTGFIINGPLAIGVTYLAEFHGAKYRSSILLWSNFLHTSGSLLLPILAWVVIPQSSWSLTLFDGAFVYNSWRIFILVCSTPALIQILTLFYLPESPRFLMSQGRNEEALEVFQKMYALNTRNRPEDFPVKSLRLDQDQKIRMERSAISKKSTSVRDRTEREWARIKPLFENPYLWKFILIATIQFAGFLSMNTLRLWMPQLFTLMENFDYENRDPSLGPPTLCEMITSATFKNATVDGSMNSTTFETCVVAPVNSKVYINSIILTLASIIGYVAAGSLVNLLGKKGLLLIAFGVPAICSFASNWSPNSDFTLAIFAVYIALTGIAVATIVTVIVDLMPTALRVMAISMTMSIGRSGVAIGNLLFPILLKTGCTVPFIFVGGFLILCFILTLFLPKPSSKLM